MNNLEKAVARGLKIDPDSSVRAHIQAGRADKVSIGKYTVLGHQSYVVTHCPINSSKEIVVEDHSWVGARAVILPGAYIARGVIIGAGAVVSGETEPFGVYAGNPIRLLRGRKIYEVLSTFVIRWLMNRSLTGKQAPDLGLLECKHIKHIFQLPRRELIGACDPLADCLPWNSDDFSTDAFLKIVGLEQWQ